MNESAQKAFNEYVVKDPRELTEDSLRFLYARRSYMTSDQIAKFEKAFEKIEKLNEIKLEKEAKETPEEEVSNFLDEDEEPKKKK